MIHGAAPIKVQMTKRTWLLVGLVGLVLTSPGVVHADPICFSTSGQIRLADGSIETFEGSFWLSDPVVSLYGADDSRGDELDRYSVSMFMLSSASYTLTGGSGDIFVWWAIDRDDRGTFVNTLDSGMFLNTSGGYLETPPLVFTSQWGGIPGVQPDGFSGLSADIFGVGQTRSRIIDMSARQVPEPQTLLLVGAGITGLVLRRRRLQS